METRFFKSAQGKIAYDEQGSGPLVLCVPSLGDIRAEYRFLTPLLVQAGFRVVSMDVRGHGESSLPWPDYSVAGVGSDLTGLIQALAGGPALIIGTSMAAGAAVWAAAERPELVAGLVLVGPFVRDMQPAWLSKLMFSPLFSGPWGTAAWLKYYRTLYPSQPPADFDQHLAAMRANLSQPGRMAAVRGMLSASKAAAQARLSRVSAPVLVLMGSRDPDFKDPAAEAQRVAHSLSAQLHLIPGAGHYPHAEMPQETAPLILDFTRTLWEPAGYVA